MRCGPATGWCGRVRAGEPFDPARDCDRCWLMTHSATHRANWGVAGPAVVVGRKPARVPLKLACAHLGAKVDPACACTDRHCLKGYGVVRLARECQTCPDHEPKRPQVPPSAATIH